MPFIKVTQNEVTRKIPVDDTLSWEDIAQRISEVFPADVGSLTLTYVDCDDDVIMLTTIKELWGALQEGNKKFDLSFILGK